MRTEHYCIFKPLLVPFLLVLFSVALFSREASAREQRVEASLATRAGSPGSIGFGLGLGDPTGLDFVWMASRGQWIHLELGTGDRALVVYGDFHWSLARILFREARLELPLSVGVGGVVGAGGKGPFGSDSLPMVGVRVPLNAELWFQTIPLAIFLEIAPQATSAFPSGFLTFQIGIRFYLGGN